MYLTDTHAACGEEIIILLGEEFQLAEMLAFVKNFDRFYSVRYLRTVGPHFQIEFYLPLTDYIYARNLRVPCLNDHFIWTERLLSHT